MTPHFFAWYPETPHSPEKGGRAWIEKSHDQVLSVQIIEETLRKVYAILSTIDNFSEIRELFDYIFEKVPESLGSGMRFHFTDMRSVKAPERDSGCLDDLSEIFRWSLLAYAQRSVIADFGEPGSRVEFHDSTDFKRNQRSRYFPIVFKKTLFGEERSRLVNVPIGFIEIPRIQCGRGILAPEQISEQIIRGIRTNFERFQSALLQEELLNLAHEDHVIQNCNNRRGFFQKISRSRKANPDEPSAVIILDLDHFKKINDWYGHDVGDAALRYVGEKILSAIQCVSHKAVIYGRLGGEEFGVYVQGPELSQAFVYQLAENLRISIKNIAFKTPKNQEVTITASIGVAISIHPKEPVRDIMIRADEAMYQAKEQGRDCTKISKNRKIVDSKKEFVPRWNESAYGEWERGINPGQERRRTVQQIIFEIVNGNT